MSDATWLCCAAATTSPACWSIPLQALASNIGAPPTDPGPRGRMPASIAPPTRLLKELRAICSERRDRADLRRGLRRLRLAPGGAQEYFGVAADIVTYGKTVGAASRRRRVRHHRFMKRLRGPPATSASRAGPPIPPYVMAAIERILLHLEEPEMRALYRDLDATWRGGRPRSIERLASAAALQSRTCRRSGRLPHQASRYNWMLQYYLKARAWP